MWQPLRKAYAYTDDRGQQWAVELSRQFGEHPDLGFGPLIGRVMPMPRSGLAMRRVNVVDRATGARRSIPVGSPSAPVLQDPPPPLQLLDRGTGRMAEFQVTSRVGEIRRWLA